MPAIHLFQRRTLLGGDDLQPGAALTITGRIFQLLVLCSVILHNAVLLQCNFFASNDNDDETKSCSKTTTSYYCLLTTLWISLSVLYCVAAIVLEARIAHWSSQGSPVQVQPRTQKVTALLEFKLVAFSVALVIIVSTGIAALCFAPAFYSCKQTNNTQQQLGQRQDDDVLQVVENVRNLTSFQGIVQWWWVAVAALLISQLAEVLVSAMFLWQLFQQPTNQQLLMANTDDDEAVDNDFTAQNYNHQIVEEMWAERCANTCQCLSATSCYMFGGRNVDSNHLFGDVARALADYLETRGVLDVVPSDIVTGLIVLQRLQRQRVYAARLEVIQQDLLTPTGSTVVDEDEAAASSNLGINNRIKATSGSIRRRTNSSNCLKGQEEGIARCSSEERLLPKEGIVAPGVAAASRRKIHHPEDEHHRALYRFDDQIGSYQQEERALLDQSDFSELFVLEEAARYAKYALAIYTWVLYLYVHPITGPGRLALRNRCKCICDRRQRSHQHQTSSPSPGMPRLSTNLMNLADENGRIEGDNLCETHKNAILLTAGLDEADLVYVQLKSSFADNPYCILLDHGWKSIVLSIRGTFSLEDCVTDVLIEPEALDDLGEQFGFDASGQYCHGGVMTCVRNVYRDLERHGLLDQLLLGENALYPDYTLRLVGHSLGAATCTCLSYMLRGKFPTLRCVNFSPPGCTLTWELATECKEWCTSCVLDTDLVPRLSLDSMERLRDEVLDLIGRIKVPKMEVARRFVHTSALWNLRLCQGQELEDKEALMETMQEILYEPDQVPDSDYQQQLAHFKTIQEQRREARGTSRSLQLYPPGRILHLAKTGEARSCVAGLAKIITCCTTNMGSQYVPMWIDNDDLNEIVVSPTMGTDHFPTRIRAILEEVAKDFGVMS